MGCSATCDVTGWMPNHLSLFTAQLARRLPARVQGYPWQLAYSTLEHGTSLKTLYRKSASLDSPVLLVIKDMDNEVRSVCSAGVGVKINVSLGSANHTAKWYHTAIKHCWFILFYSYFVLLKLNLQAGKYVCTNRNKTTYFHNYNEYSF